jgi:hypothetical protein
MTPDIISRRPCLHRKEQRSKAPMQTTSLKLTKWRYRHSSRILGSLDCPRDIVQTSDLCARARRSQTSALQAGGSRPALGPIGHRVTATGRNPHATPRAVRWGRSDIRTASMRIIPTTVLSQTSKLGQQSDGAKTIACHSPCYFRATRGHGLRQATVSLILSVRQFDPEMKGMPMCATGRRCASAHLLRPAGDRKRKVGGLLATAKVTRLATAGRKASGLRCDARPSLIAHEALPKSNPGNRCPSRQSRRGAAKSKPHQPEIPNNQNGA